MTRPRDVQRRLRHGHDHLAGGPLRPSCARSRGRVPQIMLRARDLVGHPRRAAAVRRCARAACASPASRCCATSRACRATCTDYKVDIAKSMRRWRRARLPLLLACSSTSTTPAPTSTAIARDLRRLAMLALPLRIRSPTRACRWGARSTSTRRRGRRAARRLPQPGAGHRLVPSSPPRDAAGAAGDDRRRTHLPRPAVRLHVRNEVRTVEERIARRAHLPRLPGEGRAARLADRVTRLDRMGYRGDCSVEGLQRRLPADAVADRRRTACRDLAGEDVAAPRRHCPTGCGCGPRRTAAVAARGWRRCRHDALPVSLGADGRQARRTTVEAITKRSRFRRGTPRLGIACQMHDDWRPAGPDRVAALRLARRSSVDARIADARARTGRVPLHGAPGRERVPEPRRSVIQVPPGSRRGGTTGQAACARADHREGARALAMREHPVEGVVQGNRCSSSTLSQPSSSRASSVMWKSSRGPASSARSSSTVSRAARGDLLHQRRKEADHADVLAALRRGAPIESAAAGGNEPGAVEQVVGERVDRGEPQRALGAAAVGSSRARRRARRRRRCADPTCRRPTRRGRGRAAHSSGRASHRRARRAELAVLCCRSTARRQAQRGAYRRHRRCRARAQGLQHVVEEVHGRDHRPVRCRYSGNAPVLTSTAADDDPPSRS